MQRGDLVKGPGMPATKEVLTDLCNVNLSALVVTLKGPIMADYRPPVEQLYS
jgi:hypothetical protein